MMHSSPSAKKNIEQLINHLKEPLDHPGEKALLRDSGEVVGWSVAHFLNGREQPIGENPSRKELEKLLRESPPEGGEEFAQILAEFSKKIVPNNFRLNHPGFLAFIASTPSFYSILGDWLASSLNCFAGVWMEGASAAQIEILVLDWFKGFLGYPGEARGILTSGGSEANLTALVVARQRLSFADRSRAVLYQSDQRHNSIDKAAQIIGLRPEQIRLLPTDKEFRLRAEVLAQAVTEDRSRGLLPWAVVANAGATNTGVVDPFEELANCCAEHTLWLHADAAYGWAAALNQEGKKLLRGIERANSITLDPHKWFAQTFDVGCLLVRKGELLFETFSSRPEYLQDVKPTEEEINFADYGLALTRRFRALKIWLSVKTLGLKWFRDMIERGLQLAELTERLLRQSGEFEILSPRELGIVCFRYHPPEFRGQKESDLDALNLAINEKLQQTGRFFLTSTLLRGRVALRCCFVNWRTTSADVVELVELLQEIGRQVLKNREVIS